MSILPPQEKDGEIKFFLAKSLPYRQRMLFVFLALAAVCPPSQAAPRAAEPGGRSESVRSEPTFVSTESPHFVFHFVRGTAAERDLLPGARLENSPRKEDEALIGTEAFSAGSVQGRVSLDGKPAAGASCPAAPPAPTSGPGDLGS